MNKVRDLRKKWLYCILGQYVVDTGTPRKVLTAIDQLALRCHGVQALQVQQ
jgi:hypothetical protein